MFLRLVRFWKIPYARSRAEDVQVGNENVISVVRCEFYLDKHYLRRSETMKQQITPGLGKTKGDNSEI